MKQGSQAANYLRHDKYRKRKPQPLGEMLKKKLKPENMGKGMKRGYVLRIYKPLLKKILTDKITGWNKEIESEWISKNELNNIFIIKFSTGSMWINGLQPYLFQLKEKLNERCKCNFIKKVRLK